MDTDAAFGVRRSLSEVRLVRGHTQAGQRPLQTLGERWTWVLLRRVLLLKIMFNHVLRLRMDIHF